MWRSAVKSQPPLPLRPPLSFNCTNYAVSFPSSLSRPCPPALRLPIARRFASLKVQSLDGSTGAAVAVEPSASSEYTASVGSPPPSSSMLQLSQWNLTHRHILMLNVIACAAALSATWLFFSAIPALLAFRRAAESLEKLMEVTREELPDTMAAIRLSGMEISDLTMELSDIGQEITQGVRSSTRAVRVAEERLRQFTNMPPSASLQRVASSRTEMGGPALARDARSVREGIVKGRAILQMFFTLTQFSRMALNYLTRRGKK